MIFSIDDGNTFMRAAGCAPGGGITGAEGVCRLPGTTSGSSFAIPLVTWFSSMICTYWLRFLRSMAHILVRLFLISGVSLTLRAPLRMTTDFLV